MPGQSYELFSVNATGSGAPRLMPRTNAGLIDVVSDFSWTMTPPEGRVETPSIEMVEWSLKSSAMIGAFNRFAFSIGNAYDATGNAISGGGYAKNDKLPYFGLYPATKTGFWYSLPYFSEMYRTISNSYEEVDGIAAGQIPLASRIPILGEYAGLYGLERISKAVMVGVGAERPLSYSGTNRETIEVIFVLNNTTNIHDVRRNWELIYLLSYQNSQNRKNYIVVDPPKFYTVKIEGIKYSPAMYVNELKINNMGQVKRVSLNGRIQNIPEAWMVHLSLVDLIPHSQSMLDAMREGKFDSIEATQGRTIEEVGAALARFLNNELPPGTATGDPRSAGNPPGGL